jgi:hypothetical protein
MHSVKNLNLNSHFDNDDISVIQTSTSKTIGLQILSGGEDGPIQFWKNYFSLIY